MTRRIAITTAALLTLAVPAGASAAPHARIANPGHFTAKVRACPKPEAACGGSIEFNGTIFHFAGGAMSGRTSSAGRVSHARMTFGTASTDPAVDGPLQLTFHPVQSGSLHGRFVINRSPHGAADADGLDFAFSTRVYIEVGGATVGPNCTIASAATPMAARFGGLLDGLTGDGSLDGATYDQSSGVTAGRAHVQMPGAHDCNGNEQTIDRELGIPGPGSVALNIAFEPILQTDRYRAHHHAARHRVARKRKPTTPSAPAKPQPSPDKLALSVNGGQVTISVRDTQPLMDELGVYAMRQGVACPATHEGAMKQMNAGDSTPVIEAESIATLLDTPSVAPVDTTFTRFAGIAPGQRVCGVLYLPTGVGASRTLGLASAASSR